MRKSLVSAAAAAVVLAITGFSTTALAAPAPDRGPQGSPRGTVQAVPAVALTEAEAATLLRMADEERMARDLYQAIAALYPDAVQFSNVARGEQRHYESVLARVDAYGLTRPSAVAGVYDNDEVQALYDAWLERAKVSLDEAYAVAVELERADIADLEAAIAESSHADLDRVYSRPGGGQQSDDDHEQSNEHYRGTREPPGRSGD